MANIRDPRVKYMGNIADAIYAECAAFTSVDYPDLDTALIAHRHRLLRIAIKARDIESRAMSGLIDIVSGNEDVFKD